MITRCRLIILVLLIALSLSGCNVSFRVGVIKRESEDVNEKLHTVQTSGIEEELDLLIEDFKKLKEVSEVQKLIDDYIDKSKLDIISIYYGDNNGKFYISPNVELSSDYNFTERPPYRDAVEEGKYMPDSYMDFTTNKYIQTITKPVIVEGNIIGVAGIDVYTEE
ncbi:hypothetical protein SH2C18_24270 [Clostridium sediminicola]|uniref:PDC sensor domain-containing protein n=1 Tax=Clostridium sediminicola TaxID=3114879 RepID=UPI0031F22B90